ncbi:glycosyltransferase family 4 protein [Nostoc sp. CENA67]|uniref:Glycosyltransferase family 4 protein n=1 Tax=Amazonocrinis nigriterrae CENA67 TaxID=2794033 RepID=A0A8J7LDP8_9NOST|nr:glycosyltransferase family 4 protein [Amazonocrinis nigriterrae]MBH8566031.1 glycosyltransferase family 4 protein [Amazonocrinis nigriterrae CENA67]
MRIAFATTEYVTEKYFSGGLANYLHRIAKALLSLGHEVHIVVLSEIDRDEFEYEGIQIHRLTLGKIQQRLDKLSRYSICQTSQCLDFSFQVYRKLLKLHKQQPFDIVQFPDWDACGVISSLLLPIPQVTRISAYRPVWCEKSGEERDRDEQIIEWLEWLQMRLGKHVYAPSYTLKRLLAEQAKITHVQVIRTPFYLETSDWDSSVFNEYLQGKKYLLFFGRFQLHKGFHILAQALPQVFKKHPDCHAVFVGLDLSSSLASSMKEYALSFCSQYTDRLVFIDQIPHTQLYPVIAGAKLVVLPSLIDNLPNACLEAMALGKPIIGTIGASFEELLTEGETGFLVPVGEVNALAIKINEVWMHPSLNEIGQAAKWKVQEFAIENTVKELLNYYEKVIRDIKYA